MTSIWIALFGGAGGLVVARIGALAYGQDPVALGLSALIGVALSVGLFELWRRSRQGHGALEALADGEALTDAARRQALPYSLRAPLEAALQGQRPPSATPGFTPYLGGLVVMLGLIGTFLGLVEALSGAREALSTSGGADVDGLRSGLVAPMQGLTRAFGTSVAGVAASAALGLSAVFVRRLEARVRRRLTDLIAGPLAPLTPAGRQQVAMDRLLTQGEALPSAAAALGEAVSRLKQLGDSLSKTHGDAARETVAALKDGVAQIQTSLQGAAADAASQAAQAATEAVTPLLTASLTQITESADAHLSAVQGHLSDHAEARAEAEQAHLAAIRDQAHAAAEAAERASRDHVAAMTAQITALVAGVQSATEAAVEGLRGARAAGAQWLVEAGEGLSDHLQGVREAVIQPLEALAEGHRQDAEALGRLIAAAEAQIEAHGEAMSAQRDHAVAASEAAQARITEGATALQAAATEAGAAVHALADQTGEALGGLTEQTQRTLSGLTAQTQEALTGLTSQTGEALGGLTAQAGEALTGFTAQAGESLTGFTAQAGEAIGALHARTGEALEGLNARAGEALEGLNTRAGEAIEGLNTRTGAAIEGLNTRTGEALGGLTEQTQRVLGGLTSQTSEALSGLTSQTGEALTGLTAQTSAALGGLTEQAGAAVQGLTGQVDAALQARAEAQIDLEGRMLAQHQAAVESLGAKLVAQAQGLGDDLSKTGDIVREAAELARASGVELSLVAELFTEAVDRYRGASEAWLDTLSRLEGALSNRSEGGGGQAVALGQYLDQTREVFTDTLRVQQALFNELRSLKGQEAR